MNRLLHLLRLSVRRNTRPPIRQAYAPGGLAVIEVHAYATFSTGQQAVCLTGETEDVIVTGWYLTSHVALSP